MGGAVSDVVFFHGGPGPPLLINFLLQLLPQKIIPSAYYSLILSVRNTGYSSLTALEEPIALSNSGFRYVADPPYCRRLSDFKYCDIFLFFFLFSLLFVDRLQAIEVNTQTPTSSFLGMMEKTGVCGSPQQPYYYRLRFTVHETFITVPVTCTVLVSKTSPNSCA